MTCVLDKCRQGRDECPAPSTCNGGTYLHIRDETVDEPPVDIEDMSKVVVIAIVVLCVLALLCAVLPVVL